MPPCRECCRAQYLVVFIGVSFNELVWATLYLCQIHITCGTSILFQRKEIALCTSVQLECHLTLTALHANFHSNQCTWCTSDFTYTKNFFRRLLPHLWQVCPLAGHWWFPCWYPQNLHSGRWRGWSRGLCVSGSGSVLTAPTDSSVLLVINFNYWLVCSEALQMLIALVKVRSFTRKRRSLINFSLLGLQGPSSHVESRPV